jgi:hypothetical protein
MISRCACLAISPSVLFYIFVLVQTAGSIFSLERERALLKTQQGHNDIFVSITIRALTPCLIPPWDVFYHRARLMIIVTLQMFPLYSFRHPPRIIVPVFVLLASLCSILPARSSHD